MGKYCTDSIDTALSIVFYVQGVILTGVWDIFWARSQRVTELVELEAQLDGEMYELHE